MKIFCIVSHENFNKNNAVFSRFYQGRLSCYKRGFSLHYISVVSGMVSSGPRRYYDGAAVTMTNEVGEVDGNFQIGPTSVEPDAFDVRIWCGNDWTGEASVTLSAGAAPITIVPGSKYGGGTFAPSDITAPTVPTDLVATTTASDAVTVSWTASTDYIGVAGYRVFRCTGSECSEATEITSTTETSITDTVLAASTQYRYQVSAYDDSKNESARSGFAGAMTAGAATTTGTEAEATTTPDTAVGETAVSPTPVFSETIVNALVSFLESFRVSPDTIASLRSILLGEKPEKPQTASAPQPEPKPVPSFGNGTHLVNTDIDPGTYRSGKTLTCYWARLSGLGGQLGDT